MITITLQAPKELWRIIASFADSQYAQWFAKTILPGTSLQAQREIGIIASQWRLIHDDIMRNIREG